MPSISIAVLTFNSEKTIKKCLDAISELDYPHPELDIVIVDNGSTDGTLDIVKMYPVRYYVLSEGKIPHLRNFAVYQSKSDLIAFVDSDCVIASDWLRKAVRHLCRKDIGVAGCEYSYRENASWVEKAWCTRRDQGTKYVGNLPAGNMILRRAVFDEVGGFDSELDTGEDSDFCIKVSQRGYKIIYDPAIRNVHLGVPKTLKEVLKKQIWHGKGLTRVFTTKNFKDKVFLFTNCFIIFHAIPALLLLVDVSSNQKKLAAVGCLVGIVALLSLSSAAKAKRAGTWKYFPHLIPVYYMYFAGRSFALAKIYYAILRKGISRVARRKALTRD